MEPLTDAGFVSGDNQLIQWRSLGWQRNQRSVTGFFLGVKTFRVAKNEVFEWNLLYSSNKTWVISKFVYAENCTLDTAGRSGVQLQKFWIIAFNWFRSLQSVSQHSCNGLIPRIQLIHFEICLSSIQTLPIQDGSGPRYPSVEGHVGCERKVH